MRAELAGAAREQPAAPHIRREANPHLGHGGHEPLGREPVAGVAREPDATAHDDAIHDHDERLGVTRDAGVEGVLLRPELARSIGPLAGGVVERHDVAAGAQPAVALAVEQHRVDRIVLLDDVERLAELAHHLERERVDGPRPVEGESRQPPLGAQEYVGARGRSRLLRRLHHGRHARLPSGSRATISRITSLVPSRMRCTRRSRTIFSMPYSAR